MRHAILLRDSRIRERRACLSRPPWPYSRWFMEGGLRSQTFDRPAQLGMIKERYLAKDTVT